MTLREVRWIFRRICKVQKARRRTVTDPEDLPDPAIIPISGLSRESRAYLQARKAKTKTNAKTTDEEGPDP